MPQTASVSTTGDAKGVRGFMSFDQRTNVPLCSSARALARMRSVVPSWSRSGVEARGLEGVVVGDPVDEEEASRRLKSNLRAIAVGLFDPLVNLIFIFEIDTLEGDARDCVDRVDNERACKRLRAEVS